MRYLFLLLLIPITSFSQLQESGPISFSDIQTELGITPGTANQRLSGASTPFSGSLFGDATGTINKAAPHAMSEFYGYNQVNDFIMSTFPYASAGLACDDELIGSVKWWEGSNIVPEVGDIIWNEGTSTTKFNGGGDWFRIPGEDQVIRINASGVVLEKEDCSQTFSFTLSQTTVDEDATTVDIDITSNTSWTLSEIVSWASIASPTGSGNSTKVLSIDAHTGSGTRTVTVSGTYGLGTQQSDVDQLDIQYQLITGIGSSVVSEAAACADGSAITYKSDTTSLSTATFLLTPITEDDAPAGWYSDGSIVRYWTGTVFSSTAFCA